MRRKSSVDLLPASLVCKEPIFHYTSAHGFLGVIENHSLWATEAFGLNDVAELRHGWSFTREWLDEQASDEVTDEMKSHLQDPDVKTPEVEVFICCASTLSDDASQWRIYADATRGYAIELDPRVGLAVMARGEVFLEGEQPIDYSIVSNVSAILRDHAQVTPWMHVMYEDRDKANALAVYRSSLRSLFGEYERRIRSAASWEEADGSDKNEEGR